MALMTWKRGETLPNLPPLAGLTFSESRDLFTLGKLTGLEWDALQYRLDNGHRAYIASLNHQPAAYGWVARQSASIGELNLSFEIPGDQAYLWDFKTLAEWRGLGIYPHLLQWIMDSQPRTIRQMWIIHAPENHASRRGIQRAGFAYAGRLSFLKANQSVGLVPVGEHAGQGAQLLGAMLLGEDQAKEIAPCWRCTISARRHDLLAQPDCWIGECGCSGSVN